MAVDVRKRFRHIATVLALLLVPAFLFGFQYRERTQTALVNDVTFTETFVYTRLINDSKDRNHASNRPQTLAARTPNDTFTHETKADLSRNVNDLPHPTIHDTDPNVWLGRKQTTTSALPLPYNAPVRCDLLFKGDKSEVRRAKVKNKLDLYQFPTEYDIIRDTGDCQSYVQSRGYITDSLSAEEEQFPIAFALRMHYKIAQAERLLRAIYRPQNIYCIHIDKKSHRAIHIAMKGIAACLPNVFIASKLESVVYQSFSPVQADLNCMEDLVNSTVRWKYLLNVAGTEFPLKTNLEIVRILKTLNGSNDIEQYTYPKFFLDRIAYKHRVSYNELVNTYFKKEPFTEGNVTVLKGCSYNSYTRAYIEWVLKDQLAQKFINWTKDLHSPDEVVWGSLNSLPDAPGGYPQMITQISRTFLSRAIIWYSSAAYCHGQFLRGICIFTVGDLKWLYGRWELFANKFDDTHDHVALACLEQEIRNRTLHPDPVHSVKWFGIYRAPHVNTTPPPEVDRSLW